MDLMVRRETVDNSRNITSTTVSSQAVDTSPPIHGEDPRYPEHYPVKGFFAAVVIFSILATAILLMVGGIGFWKRFQAHNGPPDQERELGDERGFELRNIRICPSRRDRSTSSNRTTIDKLMSPRSRSKQRRSRSRSRRPDCLRSEASSSKDISRVYAKEEINGKNTIT